MLATQFEEFEKGFYIFLAVQHPFLLSIQDLRHVCCFIPFWEQAFLQQMVSPSSSSSI